LEAPKVNGCVEEEGKAKRSDDTEANDKVQRLKKAVAAAEAETEGSDGLG
jgi:hypothetical protein